MSLSVRTTRSLYFLAQAGFLECAIDFTIVERKQCSLLEADIESEYTRPLGAAITFTI